MLDDCTKDEQDTKPTFQLSPTPSEENPVIRDGDENENTLFGQSCTESEDEGIFILLRKLPPTE